MFTINIKGTQNPKSPDQVKLELVFFKTGYPRVTKAINITGHLKDWGVKQQQFSAKGVEATERNKRLLEIKARYLKVVEEWESNSTNWSPVQWSHCFNKEQKKKEENKIISVSQMFDILDNHFCNRLRIKNGKTISSVGTAESYRSFRHILESYVKNKHSRGLLHLYFRDITDDFVSDFTFFLQKRGIEQGHAGNVRHNLRMFRGLVYYAKQLNRIEDADTSIFDRIRANIKPKAFEPKTIPLEILEKIKHIDLSLFTRVEKFHIDLFLFSYYTGMANVDVSYLTWDSIDKNGILKYERTKYPKSAILPFVPKAREITERYSDQCYTNYVLPIFLERHVTEAQKRARMSHLQKDVNKTLKKVTKIVKYKEHMTWYAARGTFITKCILQKFSPEEVAEMAGNSVLTIYKNYFKDRSKTKLERQQQALND